MEKTRKADTSIIQKQEKSGYATKSNENLQTNCK
jgi:hypothetical protein